MSYRVSLAGAAAVVFHTLPSPGQDALIRRAAQLADAPWDARVLPPGDDPARRVALFDDGNGLMAFHLDEAAGTIRIFNIVWIS